MEFLQQFIAEYGTMILYALLTTIASILGAEFKKIYTKYVNEKIKREDANTVVLAIQQLYKDLDGDAKLDKALEAFSDMLEKKGISISELEMRMLLEAAVGGFKKAFNKTEEVVVNDI